MTRNFTLTGVAMLALVTTGSVPSAAQTTRRVRPSLAGAVLEVRTIREAYVLGEPVELEIGARNRTPTPIVLPGAFDVWEGYLGVRIAFEDGPFLEYRGPGWGLQDVSRPRPLTIGPRQTVTTEATILYNHGMPSAHLTAQAAETITSRYLSEGYALPWAGRYRIKAVLHAPDLDDPIESAPIEIVLNEPDEADREVWSALRSDPEFGYFMQAGSPRARSRGIRRQRLVEVLERLVVDHPASRYTELLRKRVSEYRALVDDATARGLIIQ